jgi:VIT1/CCC1 family predicted Fe2+/Mn2+ transporter
VPLLFLSGARAAVAASVLGGVILSAVGAFVGFLSGTSPVRAAFRMVVLAALAAGVTVGVGRLVGASLG